MPGYKYFDEIISDKHHIEALQKAINKADRAIAKKDINANLQRPNILGILLGEKYPAGIDYWCQVGEWRDMEAKQILSGISPLLDTHKEYYEDCVVIDYYLPLLSKRQYTPGFIRLDGFSRHVLDEVQLLLELYEPNQNLTSDICGEILEVTDGFLGKIGTNSFYEIYESRRHRFQHPNDPVSYFKEIRKFDKPYWLEPVIKKNATYLDGISPKSAIYNYSEATEKRLEILKQWLKRKKLIGKNLHSRGYTWSKVLTELNSDKSSTLFEFATEGAKTRAAEKLFRIAREQRWCFFSDQTS